MVTIKFEKEINDCRSCPFHKTYKEGSPSSMCGTWLESHCLKLKKRIKEHDYENYDDDYNFEIPIDCPFKNN